MNMEVKNQNIKSSRATIDSLNQVYMVHTLNVIEPKTGLNAKLISSKSGKALDDDIKAVMEICNRK